jgi:hypothetical protein
MTKLLYFEEYVSELSKKISNREDIDLIILRAKKTIGKYISENDLKKSKQPYYIFDTENDFNYEMSKFKEWLKNNKISIDYFLNDSEYYLEFSNKVARRLGLESLNSIQVSWVRDKVDMKDKFNAIGLKTVDYCPVKSKNEIIDFFHKHNNNTIIFKPRNLMNSIQVYKIDSLDDIEKLKIDFEKNNYMVEDYCNDQEWSIESLVQDGKVIDSYVTYIPNRTLWAAIDGNLNCHMTVPNIPKYFKFIPKEYIQKIVTGMELKNGAMTIEVFIDNDGNIMPSELGWRLPGCQATTNHGLSYGFDMYEALIDIAIHKPVHLKYKNPITSVGDLYLPNKSGYIKEITPLSKLLLMNGVINGQMFIETGDYQEKRRVGNDASGWVQVEGTDVQDTLDKMQFIYDNFIIEVEENYKRNEVKRYVKKL